MEFYVGRSLSEALLTVPFAHEDDAVEFARGRGLIVFTVDRGPHAPGCQLEWPHRGRRCVPHNIVLGDE